MNAESRLGLVDTQNDALELSAYQEVTRFLSDRRTVYDLAYFLHPQ